MRCLHATILARNIDNSSLAGNSTSATITNTKSVGSSWVNFGTHTITKTGLYHIKLYVSGGSAGTTEMRSNAKISVGGSSILEIGAWSISNYAGNNFAESGESDIFWLNKDDVITLSARNNNWTGNTYASATIHQIY